MIDVVCYRDAIQNPSIQIIRLKSDPNSDNG